MASVNGLEPWAIEEKIKNASKRLIVNPNEVPKYSNLNDYKTPGFYIIPTSTSTIENAPVERGVSASLVVLEGGGGRTFQVYIPSVVGGAGKVSIRLFSKTETWEDWQGLAYSSDLIVYNPLKVYVHGDSQVGARYSWPNLMKDSFLDVVNHGKSGLTPDNITLVDGAKVVVIPAGTYPKDEKTQVPAPFPIVTRSIRGCDGYVNKIPVRLSWNGQDEIREWYIKPSKDLVLDKDTVFVSTLFNKMQDGRHIVWMGGNSIRHELKGEDETVASHAINAYSDALSAWGPSTIICGYVPAYGDWKGRDVSEKLAEFFSKYTPNNFLNIKYILQKNAEEILGRELTSGEKEDIKNGYAPRSMFRDGDTVHMKDEVHVWLAKFFTQFLNGAGPELVYKTHDPKHWMVEL